MLSKESAWPSYQSDDYQQLGTPVINKPSNIIFGQVRQTHAPRDLQVVSWRPMTSVFDLRFYAYKRTVPGSPSPIIYLIDRGIDTNPLVRK